MTEPPSWPGSSPVTLLTRSRRAVLWRATRERDGREVVIKVAAPHPMARLALAAEQEVLERADHPGVVPLLGLVPGPGLVLAHLGGGSLADRLQHGPVPTAGEGAGTVLAIAAALAHLHARGTAHGDLSPANVLFHHEARPVLIDPAGPGAPAATPGYRRADGSATDAGERDRHALVVLGIELCGPHSDLGRALRSLARPGHAVPSLDEIVGAAEHAARPRPAPGTLDAGRPGALPVEPPTTAWGPAPPPATDEPASRGRRTNRRPLAVAATAAAGLVLAAAGAVLVGPGRPAAACPDDDPVARAAPGTAGADAAGEQVWGDLDGDGCDELVHWWADEAEVRLPDGRRFALGRPGDRLVLGDWTCDHLDRPGVYRPSTGQVFTFDRWPQPGESATSDDATETGIRGGVPEVVAPTGAGCDLVAVAPP